MSLEHEQEKHEARWRELVRSFFEFEFLYNKDGSPKKPEPEPPGVDPDGVYGENPGMPDPLAEAIAEHKSRLQATADAVTSVTHTKEFKIAATVVGVTAIAAVAGWEARQLIYQRRHPKPKKK